MVGEGRRRGGRGGSGGGGLWGKRLEVRGGWGGRWREETSGGGFGLGVGDFGHCCFGGFGGV